MDYANEPAITTRVMLETRAGESWESHPARIANLTRHELWIRIDESLGELVYPERPVRLVLNHGDGGTQTAETMVLWHIGMDGLMVVLMRPDLWDPPSKRAHSRARLAVPVSLYPGDGAPISGRTTNVGVGGFFCISDGPVDPGKQMPVSILLAPDQSFDCEAEVVRVEADPDDPSGRQALLAFRFLGLTRDEQAALSTKLVALTDDLDDEYVPLAWRNRSRKGRLDA